MISGKELHYFSEGNRIAKVFTRGQNSYRVWVYDSYLETEDEKVFLNEQAAEDYAEDWVLNK
jgi:hypothetical protein